ncbi:hypothetical protein AR9_g018 [Bacillus phage AR9]|uniref:Uncharacterized protein n=2 Tax=Bacillus phage PBS1 TaxID=10683 RepID=A0A172JHR9_BPPB1|nr:hypothetical protein BI022_gp018 [Bacillus phage AR9]YP_009664404.1 hypothetical protein FK780_gp244 [Bacillus phage PBS1]AMS01103.1 hypothetical protein AR9_g018 [Bacillus phage AR9]ASU00025.1 hypothetical protein PBI_PBS1_203 [Bacillus phage PBS1]BDE75461.1 hypothetical protein [Bacillus phage PBS1]
MDNDIMKVYYEENKEELLECAKESLLTANEAEKSLKERENNEFYCPNENEFDKVSKEEFNSYLMNKDYRMRPVSIDRELYIDNNKNTVIAVRFLSMYDNPERYIVLR